MPLPCSCPVFAMLLTCPRLALVHAKPWKEHCKIISRARQTRAMIMPMLDTHPWMGDNNIMAPATIWYKARTCQGQGTCMKRAWPYHCNNIAKASIPWQEHGNTTMARLWQEHGANMARTWQTHARAMILPCSAVLLPCYCHALAMFLPCSSTTTPTAPWNHALAMFLSCCSRDIMWKSHFHPQVTSRGNTLHMICVYMYVCM
jgi:hypothetical protein